MLTHFTFVSSTPLSLAKAGKSWRCASPGGAARVLPSRSFGFAMPVSLRVQMFSGVLSNTAPTTLIFAPCAIRGITTTAPARPTSAPVVSTRRRAGRSRRVGPGSAPARGQAHDAIERQTDDRDPQQRPEGDGRVEIHLRVDDDHAEPRL